MCLTLIERGSRGVEMNKSIVLRVLCAAVVLATLASAPESVLAQRGGHGGGGFHGGGWGGGHYGGSWGGGHYGGYHGGGYSGWNGGHHGGGYYGWRGGYYGGRGGYWGYSGYGYGGWGFGLSFSFGYPYGYADGWAPPYYPYYYYPYYYPYPPYYVSVPTGDPSGYSATVYRTGSDVRVNSPVEASAPVARPPALRGTPNPNSPTMNYAAYTPAA